MVGVQRLLDIGPVVPYDCKECVSIAWLQQLGFPPAAVSGLPGLVLPHWSAARELLEGLSTFIWSERLLCRHNRGVEIWRRWPLGIPDSQLDFSSHSLSCSSHLYTPRIRLLVKTPTSQWLYQQEQAQVWLAKLRSAINRSGMADRSSAMYHLCALYGVYSKSTVSALTAALPAGLNRLVLLTTHLEHCNVTDRMRYRWTV
eukprot:1869997-Amphidinium_carterae.1